MNVVYKIIVILLFIVVILSLSGTLYFYEKINSAYDEEMTYAFSDNPKYYFSLILNTNDGVYWQEFKEGVYEAAKANNAAIEFNLVENIDGEGKTIEYIDIAVKSNVDGIIVAGENSSDYVKAVNKAIEDDMQVLLVGEEPLFNNVFSYIGTNSYEYGVQAAKLISQIEPNEDPINLAVILSSQSDENENSVVTFQSDIMMNGIKSVVETEKRINLVSTLHRKSDLLGAEDLTRNILTDYDDVDVIFCTNAKDTEAAARVIIERNLVGQVFVVGTNVTETIINYIDKEIIFGTLDKNGYDAGYNSVEVSCKKSKEEFQPSYVDVDIDIYTKINIWAYEKGNKR